MRRRFFKFTLLEMIVGGYMTLLGFIWNFYLGFFALMLVMGIHTCSYFLIKGEKNEY